MHIGIIPVRAGSKGIPGKNRKPLLGRPLFAWAVGAALRSSLDLVVLYTDDEKIIDYATEAYKFDYRLVVLRRPPANANDTASTDEALRDCLQQLEQDYKTVTLIQATSPLVCASDIDACIHAVANDLFDSALSVVRSHRFLWSPEGQSKNYEPKARPRRQEWAGELVENGAVYTTTRQAFVNSSFVRISGRIKPIEMQADTLFEIDEASDWPLIENLLQRRLKKRQSTKSLRYLVLDVDGVLTDGTAQYGPAGEQLKSFSLRDGMGLELLQAEGIEPLVMTRENSASVSARVQKLGLTHYFPGTRDKFAQIEAFLEENGASWQELAYIGDDVNDLAGLCAAGLSFCPADAEEDVRAAVDLVLSRNGGHGAVREACNYILRKRKTKGDAT